MEERKVKGKQKLTNLSGDAIRVYQYLRRGQKNARCRNFLVQKTGLDDRRVRKAVAELRSKGYPVCSTTTYPGGYWLTDDAVELLRFISQLEIQRDYFNKAIKKLRQRLQEVENGKVRF